jgi:dihydrofolate synthase/folylpolyglutamate synthase
MNCNEAIEYIHSVSWNKSRPGLSRTKELLRLMGNPEKNLEFVHVVGTNGKGSTAKMLSSVLTEAGYRTGLYVSPYVVKFNERIQVSGEMIPDESLSEITEFVKEYADSMEDHPTEFEIVTAIGFEYFRRMSVDVVILEAGMGGLLDSTNVIPSPKLVIITEIGLDHTGVLGNSVEEIAETKAGVIKEGTRVLSFATCEASENVIKKVCEGKNVPLYNPDFESVELISSSVDGLCLNVGQYKNLSVGLAGKYQLRNVAAVVKAVEILSDSFNISEGAVYSGFKKAVWHGRFEKLSENPLVITDGGHNPQGIRAAVDSFRMHFGDEKALVVFGVMGDKDVNTVISIVSEIADQVITVKPNNPRAAESGDLCEAFMKRGIKALDGGGVSDGVKLALEVCNGRKIFALGSLYMYPEISKIFKK